MMESSFWLEGTLAPPAEVPSFIGEEGSGNRLHPYQQQEVVRSQIKKCIIKKRVSYEMRSLDLQL